MTVVDDAPAPTGPAPPAAHPRFAAVPPRRAGRSNWIDDWDPEDEKFWAEGGARVARRNLIFSVLSEHIGFSIWTMWSTLVLFLGPEYGLTPAQKSHADVCPDRVRRGAPPALHLRGRDLGAGGRNWTVISAAMLLVPTTLTAILLEPGVGLSTLLILGAIAGVGEGGDFASSMTNINSFYPNRLKGWVLGLNAAGGNLGVATIQVVGLLVLATAGALPTRAWSSASTSR